MRDCLVTAENHERGAVFSAAIKKEGVECFGLIHHHLRRNGDLTASSSFKSLRPLSKKPIRSSRRQCITPPQLSAF